MGIEASPHPSYHNAWFAPDVEARKQGSLMPNALGKLPRTKGLPHLILQSPCLKHYPGIFELALCDCSTAASPRAKAD